MKKLACALALVPALWACQPSDTLPIYGERYLNAQGDTVYHRIGAFSLTNQLGQAVTEADMAGKVYVADFFFTNCPSICPATTGQKLRIYERFGQNPHVRLLSHTVDPQRDSVGALRDFAANIGAEAPAWLFLTGAQDSLYALARRYFVAVGADTTAPGGYDHSDKLMLIDTQGRVRGGYSGTDKARVDRLMDDLQRLLREEGLAQ
jgi:protein SCO1/2